MKLLNNVEILMRKTAKVTERDRVSERQGEGGRKSRTKTKSKRQVNK